MYSEHKKTKKGKEANIRVAGVVVFGPEAAAAESSNQDASTPRLSLIDSGANAHMFCSQELFDEYRTETSSNSIGTADGSKTITSERGKVLIGLSEGVDVELSNVLHAPKLSYNLVSVSALTDNGITVVFEGDYCRMSKNGIHIGLIKKDPFSRLYVLPSDCFTPTEPTAATAKIWHERSGHTGFRRVAELHKYVDGVPPISVTPNELCASCECGKAHKIPYEAVWNHRKKGGTTRCPGSGDQ